MTSNSTRFRFPRILGQITNEPLAVTQEALEAVLHVISQKAETEIIVIGDKVRMQTGDSADVERDNRPYTVSDGVAVIPVKGELAQRVSGLRPYSGLVGYNQVLRMAEMAQEDSDATEILFDYDSPGGVVKGLFDTVDALFEMRGKKPMTALVSGHSYSAAYALASAADKIKLSRTSGVGSIGVIALYKDVSQLLEKQGIKVEIVHAGAHKADMTGLTPLSVPARARLQKQVDETYSLFVGTVARNRGITEDAVRQTEALTFRGQRAVEIGLADEVIAIVAGGAAYGRSARAAKITVKEKDTMSWKHLCEQTGLEVQDSDEANEKQFLALFRKLQLKANDADAVTRFCALHSVESLDAMTAKVQTLIPASEKAELEQNLKRLTAEARVKELMAPESGKITEAYKDWAIDFATRDPEGFEAVMKGAPRMVPANDVPAGTTKENPDSDQGGENIDPDEKAELEAEYGKDNVAEALRDTKRQEA